VIHFLKLHWLYILIGFLVVVLAGIGITIFRELRLRQEDVLLPAPEPEVTVTEAPSPSPTPPAEEEISAPSTGTETEKLQCIDLVAEPSSGSVPFTASFSATAKDPQARSVLFHFFFGDDTEQSIEKNVTALDGIAVQYIQHTYTEPGLYTAGVTLENELGDIAEESCTTTIQAGGIARTEEMATSSAGATGGLTVATPSATLAVVSLTPTATLSIAVTPTAAVAVPDIPEAGGFLPTVFAGLGGIFIVVIALLL